MIAREVCGQTPGTGSETELGQRIDGLRLHRLMANSSQANGDNNGGTGLRPWWVAMNWARRNRTLLSSPSGRLMEAFWSGSFGKAPCALLLRAARSCLHCRLTRGLAGASARKSLLADSWATGESAGTLRDLYLLRVAPESHNMALAVHWRVTGAFEDIWRTAC